MAEALLHLLFAHIIQFEIPTDLETGFNWSWSVGWEEIVQYYSAGWTKACMSNSSRALWAKGIASVCLDVVLLGSSFKRSCSALLWMAVYFDTH